MQFFWVFFRCLDPINRSKYQEEGFIHNSAILSSTVWLCTFNTRKISLCPVLVHLLLPWWNTWGKMLYKEKISSDSWPLRSEINMLHLVVSFTSKTPMLFKTSIWQETTVYSVLSPSSKQPPTFDPWGSSLIAWPTPHHLQIETKLQPVSPCGRGTLKQWSFDALVPVWSGRFGRFAIFEIRGQKWKEKRNLDTPGNCP